jgi:molecular chaperone DnaK
MVADAEAHHSEDEALRAQVDARNELDTVAYDVFQTLEENAATVSPHERSRAELLINDARSALEEQADFNRLRALSEELYQVLQSLTVSADAAATPDAGGPTQSLTREDGDDSDDVVDADITTR